MGRYYNGQISGKFWFGVQSSDDASYFGIEHKDVTIFYLCGCGCESPKDKEYCRECFSCYEEHRQAMLEDEDVEFGDDDNTWYVSNTEIFYEFDETDIGKVEEEANKLEEIVGKYMDSYEIHDEDMEITYSYMLSENMKDDDLVYIARLCLGRQILYCLKKHGTCCFSSEC